MPFDKKNVEPRIQEDINRSESVYSLQPHEIKSLQEIQESLDKGKAARESIENFLAYLEHLEMKLSTIMATEEKEGLVNLHIKNDISSIRELKQRAAIQLKKKQAKKR